MRNKRLLGNAALMLTAVIWGAAFSFQSMAMDSMTPLTFTAARMIPAALCLWGLEFFMAKKEKGARGGFEGKSSSGKSLLGGAVCGFFLYAGTALQQFGIMRAGAGKSGFLTALYTVLVPLFAFLVFRRRFAFNVWLGAGLALTGLYLLSVNESLEMHVSDLFLVACAICFAFQILSVDIFIKDCAPVRLSAMQFTFCTLYALAAAFIFEEPTLKMMISSPGPTLFSGVVSGGIGYTLQIVGQKYTEPSAGAILLSLESVFAAVFGAMLLGERMSIREITGGLIMVAAAIIVQLGTEKEAVRE